MASSQAPDKPRTAQSRLDSAFFWGLVLVVGGVVLLTLTVGLVPAPSATAVGAAFAVTGVLLLAAYLVAHAHWWTLLAGPMLLALGAVILLPGGGSGAIFLGGIGLGFVLVALTGIERWWAIIPAGTLLTLALITLISDAVGGLISGVVLFAGLGATFGVLALIRINGRPLTWPIFPALGCFAFAILVATGTSWGTVIWPVAMVAAGIFLVIRATTRRA